MGRADGEERTMIALLPHLHARLRFQLSTTPIQRKRIPRLAVADKGKASHSPSPLPSREKQSWYHLHHVNRRVAGESGNESKKGNGGKDISRKNSNEIKDYNAIVVV